MNSIFTFKQNKTKRIIVYITILILIIFYNNQFCQSKHRKLTYSEEVKIVKHKPAPITKDLTKPKGESISVTKPTRVTNLPNPPQRVASNTNFTNNRPQHRRYIADNLISVELYYDKAIACDSYSNFEESNEWEEEEDITIEEKEENYYPIVKYLNDKELIDEEFPIYVKNIKFDYLRREWINLADLPESLIDDGPGYYSIYRITFDAYVFDLNYHYPFAILITYPDYSNDIIIYNYDSQNLQADSVYTFEEEIPLKNSGEVWLTLGYYDLEYDQFYSAVLSPYITKRKVYIPLAGNL